MCYLTMVGTSSYVSHHLLSTPQSLAESINDWQCRILKEFMYMMSLLSVRGRNHPQASTGRASGLEVSSCVDEWKISSNVKVLLALHCGQSVTRAIEKGSRE